MIRSLAVLLAAWCAGGLAAADLPVRVMSVHLGGDATADGWERRKSFLAGTVAAFDPDLLGTLDAQAGPRDFLADRLTGHTVLAAGMDGGDTAIFFRRDRYEMLADGHFWLSPTPDAPGLAGWDAARPRVAAWVRLKERVAPAAPPVFFLNAQLDDRGAKARVESTRLIRRKVAELGTGCRVVVTGDFSAGEGSDPYKQLFEPAGPLTDTFRATHPVRGPEEGTDCGFDPARTRGDRVDWIACSPDWEVRLAGIDRTARDGRTPASHFPVTAVLRAASPARTPTLRVLGYNIHHGEGTDGKIDLPRLARVIRSTDPDLVALQEVDDRTRRSGGVDQTAELARLTGLHGRFGKQLDYQGGGYGQAVLARFPPGTMAVHILPGEPDRERRIAYEVRFSIGGREMSFVTTHLHHQNAAFRERQAATLNDLFAAAGRPVVLAGDLNAVPDSRPIGRLTAAGWVNATASGGLLTFPAPRPVKQIDYVLYRPAGHFRTVAATAIDEPVASDHRPVLAVLEWQRE